MYLFLTFPQNSFHSHLPTWHLPIKLTRHCQQNCCLHWLHAPQLLLPPSPSSPQWLSTQPLRPHKVGVVLHPWSLTSLIQSITMSHSLFLLNDTGSSHSCFHRHCPSWSHYHLLDYYPHRQASSLTSLLCISCDYMFFLKKPNSFLPS